MHCCGFSLPPLSLAVWSSLSFLCCTLSSTSRSWCGKCLVYLKQVQIPCCFFHVSEHLSCVSVAGMNIMTKNTLRMKGFVLLRLPHNCPSWKAVGAEAHGRNLEQELKQRSQRKKCCKLAGPPRLAQPAVLYTQSHLPWEGLHPQWCGPSHFNHLLKMPSGLPIARF